MPTPPPPPAGPTVRPTPPDRRFVHPEPVDLTTAWRAEERLAADPSRPHHWCPDRHGWLLRSGLDEVLAPVLVPDAAGAASFYRFADLDASVATALLDRLDPGYLAAERQNDGPSIGAVLRAVVRHPGRLRAHGYVVGPARCDERVTVEGVLVRTDHEFVLGDHHGPGCQCDELERFVATLGVDDAHVPPHEVTRWWGRPGDLSPAEPAEHWYRLWWD